MVEAEAGYGPELMGRRIRMGEGLAGVAAESGEPVLANSVVKEPRYIALHPGIRSALSLPLKYRDELMGVLSLESRKAYAFSQQDVLTLANPGGPTGHCPAQRARLPSGTRAGHHRRADGAEDPSLLHGSPSTASGGAPRAPATCSP